MEFLAGFLTFDPTVQHRAGEHSVTYVENSSILFIVAIDAAQQSHRMQLTTDQTTPLYSNLGSPLYSAQWIAKALYLVWQAQFKIPGACVCLFVCVVWVSGCKGTLYCYYLQMQPTTVTTDYSMFPIKRTVFSLVLQYIKIRYI